MPSFGSPTGDVLYLIVCAAPPARTATTGVVRAAQHAGWDVSVIATPAALGWLPADLAELTGHAVRTQPRGPEEQKAEPLGDAVLVAPATFNTINKWALGINDTLALGLLNEALGRSVPIAAVPWLNSALRAHPAYEGNVRRLADAGVHFATDDIDLATPEVFAVCALETLDTAVSTRTIHPPPR
jgi:phosphopantothenoylcysteine decarboxylase